MDAILRAILDDDRAGARELLKAAPNLATCLIREARLYRSKIFHWIYARDTALHLGAAGHRVELVRLLLPGGADPNSAKNHQQSSPLHYAADGYINGFDWTHRGKHGQSNACSMPAPKLMRRTKWRLALASRRPHAMCRRCEMPARRRQ